MPEFHSDRDDLENMTLRDAIDQADSMKKQIKVSLKKTTPKRSYTSYIAHFGAITTAALSAFGILLAIIGCAGLLEAVMRGGDLVGLGVLAIAGSVVALVMIMYATALYDKYEELSKPPVLDNLRRVLSELGFDEIGGDH
jgi:hypothetical protein